jgi:PAS domain S-box-containing protein
MTVAEASGTTIRNAKTYQQITLLFDQIEENERFLADILDCIRPQLLVVDKNKRLVLVNKILINAMGKSENDLLGRNYHSLWTDSPCSKEDCPINRVLNDGRVAMLQHQENGHWYERTASPMVGEDGSVEYVIEVIRDVTAKKQLEEEHLQRMKLQGVVELAGTVAHEINSPLFAALGTAQLLEDDLSKEQTEDIQTIIRNLKEIKKLTNKMTTMTGFESKDYVGETKIATLT